MTSGSPRCLAPFLLAVALSSPGVALAQTPQPEGAFPDRLDPDSPLADLPDLGVEWPDLPPEEAGDPGATIAQPDAEARRYTVLVEGLPRDQAVQAERRFAEISSLKAAETRPANLAQLSRRVRDDSTLLRELLRAEGFYDADVDSRIEAVADRIAVTLIVTPGPLYRFDAIRVTGLEAQGTLREAFPVRSTDPVDAEKVMAAETELKVTLANKGYPFATVNSPEIVVDHDTQSAQLDLAVDTKGQRRFGRIIAEGKNAPFGARHMGVIARFRPGDLYNQAEVDDLKRAMIATGLVSAVTAEPKEGDAPGTADIVVTITPAPMRTIAAEVGYGTGEGVRASASWTHRNLIRPEGAVTFSGVAGTREQALASVLRMSNWQRRDWVLNARVAASNTQRNAYDARTFQLAANLERQTNLIWQKKWTWNLGFELLASQERDIVSGDFGRNTFFIGALPLLLAYDGSDDLLDPRRGFRLSGRFSPEVSFQGGASSYARAQIDASAYLPASARLTFAGRVRLASITGANRLNIAPSRRYYAGGGGSVRGYGYQAIGPRDAFGDPAGGRSLTEFSLEARLRVGAFGVVPFVDGGNIYTSSLPKFGSFRLGAGLGVRYHSSFGPIRLDLGTPINRRPGETRLGLYVSLGQAF